MNKAYCIENGMYAQNSSYVNCIHQNVFLILKQITFFYKELKTLVTRIPTNYTYFCK